VVLLSAQGKRFDQKLASELAELEQLVLICGRYEGVDERVARFVADREMSIGDYVLSGGELGAAVIVDTVTRLVPGAVGNEASTLQESFAARRASRVGNRSDGNVEPTGAAGDRADKSVRSTSVPDSTCGSGGLLDYPHYTRPADFRGMKVPEVLLNGNHEEIRRWRRRSALAKTLANRPDLLDRAELGDDDRELIREIEASSY
jgi:tRNA (guanine37-N1)-methyltransferase